MHVIRLGLIYILSGVLGGLISGGEGEREGGGGAYRRNGKILSKQADNKTYQIRSSQ